MTRELRIQTTSIVFIVSMGENSWLNADGSFFNETVDMITCFTLFIPAVTNNNDTQYQ